jgi:hypothetical protein
MSRSDIKTLGAVALILSTPVAAGPRDALLTQYAAEAKVATPAFSAFSAARGKTLHSQTFVGGKADTPACVSCHGSDPRAAGRTPSGKAVEAMAVSVTPTRYRDAAKVEKWFRRNCNEVLGRACSPQEKGDWLTYMSQL